MDVSILGEVEVLVPVAVIILDGGVCLVPQLHRMRSAQHITPSSPPSGSAVTGPVKSPQTEMPLLILGPGGDYFRNIYAADLTGGCARCNTGTN
jgi:hypothetical protein